MGEAFQTRLMVRMGWWLGVVLGVVVGCADDENAPKGNPDTGGAAGAAGAAVGGGGVGAFSGGGGIAASGGASGVGGMSGTGGGPVDAGVDAATCGQDKVPFAANANCVDCVHTKCCSAMQVCADEPECVALRVCGGKLGCQSGPCWHQCQADHAEGRAAHQVFVACLVHECPSACGHVPFCGVSILDATCNTCMQANCCEELFTASQDVDFWKFALCWSECTTTACVSQCWTDHPAGVAKHLGYGACAGQMCPGPCDHLVDAGAGSTPDAGGD